MTRSLAVAGAPHGILVNAIAPAALTRMAGLAGAVAHSADPMSPDLVAPMAAYLAHETCPVTGEVYTAGGGRPPLLELPEPGVAGARSQRRQP